MPTLNLNGLRLDYVDSGHGLVIIFLPGLCGSKAWFCYQIAGLSDNFRVIAMNFRPFGKWGYSLELLTQDINQLLTQLRTPAAAVCGHGLGALVAIQFALSYPQRCLGLILSSASPSFCHVTDEQIRSDMIIGQPGRSDLWGRILNLLFGKSKSRIDCSSTDPLEFLALNNGAPDIATLDARIKLMRETDLTPKLDRLRMPALIVAGAKEPDYILTGCETLYEQIPDSTLEIIEDANHYHFYLRHDQFNTIVTEFLLTRISPP